MLLLWFIVPTSKYGNILQFNYEILALFCVSVLGSISILLAGWSSNSKYAFLGALRSAAQMISYEISMGLLILTVAACAGSLNLFEIVYAQKDLWFFVPLFPCFLMFFVTGLAETNRPPFDLPEAEAELVSGFNIEYASMGFALFFLGETANIFLMSTMIVLLFFGGWLVPLVGSTGILIGSIVFAIKIVLVASSFVWVRSTFPRYRYDQLMYLGWKVFLPFSLGFFIFVVSVLFLVY